MIVKFANWLVDKFDLMNNSTVSVNPFISFPRIPFYSNISPSDNYSDFRSHALEIGYNSVSRNGWMSINPFVSINGHPDLSISDIDFYIFGLFLPNHSYGSFVVVPDISYLGSSLTFSPSSVTYLLHYTNSYNMTTPGLPFIYNSDFGYYVYNNYSQFTLNSINPLIPVYSSLDLGLQALSDYLNSTPSSLVINTTTINIPDPDSGDGLLVTVPGAEWGDTLIEVLDLIERLIGLYDNTQLEIISIVDTLEHLLQNLQSTVSVDNIPGGVVLDYDNYDIPLEHEWGILDQFYGSNIAGEEPLYRPFRILKSLIWGDSFTGGLPEPVLLFAGAVVVFIVGYGFIRMGRDSH